MQITLKLATSLDGKIALPNGESQWITGAKSRAYGHQLRATHDAIIVGINTALADNPLLTARSIPLPANQPVRIIADSKGRLSPESRLANSGHLSKVVVATSGRSNTANISLLEALGVEHWACKSELSPDRVDLMALCDWAKASGIRSVLVEGGGQLAASFLKLGLVNQIEWFRAPIIIGGDGVSGIGDMSFSRLSDVGHWTPIQTQTLGYDSHTTYINFKPQHED